MRCFLFFHGTVFRRPAYGFCRWVSFFRDAISTYSAWLPVILHTIFLSFSISIQDWIDGHTALPSCFSTVSLVRLMPAIAFISILTAYILIVSLIFLNREYLHFSLQLSARRQLLSSFSLHTSLLFFFFFFFFVFFIVSSSFSFDCISLLLHFISGFFISPLLHISVITLHFFISWGSRFSIFRFSLLRCHFDDFFAAVSSSSIDYSTSFRCFLTITIDTDILAIAAMRAARFALLRLFFAVFFSPFRHRPAGFFAYGFLRAQPAFWSLFLFRLH